MHRSLSHPIFIHTKNFNFIYISYLFEFLDRYQIIQNLNSILCPSNPFKFYSFNFKNTKEQQKKRKQTSISFNCKFLQPQISLSMYGTVLEQWETKNTKILFDIVLPKIERKNIFHSFYNKQQNTTSICVMPIVCMSFTHHTIHSPSSQWVAPHPHKSKKTQRERRKQQKLYFFSILQFQLLCMFIFYFFHSLLFTDELKCA